MAEQPQLDNRLVVRLTADWIEEPFYFFVGDTATPDDFTGCTVTGGLYRNGVLCLALTTENDRIELIEDPAQINIVCPLSAMLAPTGPGPGTYSLALTLVTPTAGEQDLLGAVVDLVAP